MFCSCDKLPRLLLVTVHTHTVQEQQYLYLLAHFTYQTAEVKFVVTWLFLREGPPGILGCS